jgi:aryl sulfotransferase
MKANATKSVPLGGAFWDAGADVFINKGINGRWRDTLTEQEVKEYETRAVAELREDGLATGERWG